MRKTTRLHQWDVMRANKAPMSWGLEVRVPFLDKAYLECVMNMDPEEKMCDMAARPDGAHPKLEKYVLRKAFDVPEDPYLPDSVLWRQKEHFSDGVGYDWVDGLRAYAEEEVSDEDFAGRSERFPLETPNTKEEYMLMDLFVKYFPEKCGLEQIPTGKSIACSTPEAVAWHPEWEASAGDISGRAVDVHDASGGFSMEADHGAAVNGAAEKAVSDAARGGVAARARAAGHPARRRGMGGLALPAVRRVAAPGRRPVTPLRRLF